jgi:omega-amidase
MTARTLTVSLAQMDVRLGRPADNLATMQAMVAEAGSRGSDVVVLPELWSTGYDLANAEKYVTAVGQGMFAEMAAAARQNSVAVIGSCLARLGPGQFGNTAACFRPDGQLAAAYSKIHLFGLMDEDQYLWPGSSPEVVALDWGTAGLAICYDLRFPELFRSYALAGVEIVFLPAEWPRPRLAHWLTLLQARAIENQVYMVACNRVGQSGDYDFFGHSAIVDPWGEIVIEGETEETVLTAEIDLDLVSEVRTRLPVLADRRPDAYGRLGGQQADSQE